MSVHAFCFGKEGEKNEAPLRGMKIALRANEAGVFAPMKCAVHIAEALLEQSYERWGYVR